MIDFNIHKGIINKDLLEYLYNISSTLFQKDLYTYIHLSFRLLFIYYFKFPSFKHKQRYYSILNQLTDLFNSNSLNFGINCHQYKNMLSVYHSMNNVQIDKKDNLNYMIYKETIDDKLALYHMDIIVNVLFPIDQILPSFIIVYNYIIKGKNKYLQKKLFKRLIFYLIMNFYSEKVQFIINLNLCQNMILNLFLWKISQKFNEIKTINKDSNIAYISIVNTVKLYDRISFRIKMKFFFHEKIYYIYKMELISLFNLGYYSDAKKRCLFLLNTLLITNENKEDLKMKLCIC